MWVETRFELVERLVGLDTVLVGPTGTAQARFILDTGAVMTTMVPRVAESIGYSSADRLGRTVTRTAVGEEHGYIVRCDVSALGFRMQHHHVVVAELGYGIDGLLGLNFLRHSISSFVMRSNESSSNPSCRS